MISASNLVRFIGSEKQLHDHIDTFRCKKPERKCITRYLKPVKIGFETDISILFSRNPQKDFNSRTRQASGK